MLGSRRRITVPSSSNLKMLIAGKFQLKKRWALLMKCDVTDLEKLDDVNGDFRRGGNCECPACRTKNCYPDVDVLHRIEAFDGHRLSSQAKSDEKETTIRVKNIGYKLMAMRFWFEVSGMVSVRLRTVTAGRGVNCRKHGGIVDADRAGLHAVASVTMAVIFTSRLQNEQYQPGKFHSPA